MGTKLGSFLREAGHTKQRVHEDAAVRHPCAVGDKANKASLSIIYDPETGECSVCVSVPNDFGQADDIWPRMLDAAERHYAQQCSDEDSQDPVESDEIPDFDW